MAIRVEVLLGHHDRGGLLEGARDRQVFWHGAHLAACLARDVDELRIGNPYHVSLLEVEEDPLRVGGHEAFAVGRIHHEVTESLVAVHAIGPGRRSHGVAEVGETADLDLPCGEHPPHMVLVEVVEPDAERLGLKGRAVLQVVHHRNEREVTVLVAFAVPDPVVEVIHGAPAT